MSFNLFFQVILNFILLSYFNSSSILRREGGDKEDDLNGDEKIEKMFGLPDYLYSVKESLKYKKTEENLQKRNQGFKYRYFNFKLEIPIQNSALYTSKSQIAANINSRSNMNNTDTKDFDEDEDNNEEEEIEENDLDNNKVLSKIEKDIMAKS